ncbi:unnamed protein product [Caenorhabditis sp. 36 PRJEB53466]|nr:unnamed protein product [Caenorhabditis sp. 36 PRJEB53466]
MSDEVFKAFIGGLPFDSLASDVEACLKYADFNEDDFKNMDIHLVRDRDTGDFKGFAYVTFKTEEELERAIRSLNDVSYGNRVLKVNRAQQRDRGGRGGGRGGFGGDRDRGGRGGGGGGFRRGGDRGGHRGGDRFNNDGGNRGGWQQVGGNHKGGYRNRKESEDQHEERRPGHRQSEDGPEGASAAGPPAERPRLNLKPRTTDTAEIEARQKREEEETKRRQEKLFG